MKKSTALAGAVIGAAVTGWVVYDNLSLAVTRRTLYHPDLPPAFDGMRVAHITDLHNESFGPHQKMLLDAIFAEDAEMAFITGDLIDKRRTDPGDIAPALDLLAGLSGKMPVYRVSGNHEAISRATETLDRMAAPYATLLDEKAVTLTRAGDSITLCGMNDPDSIGPDLEFGVRLRAFRKTLPQDGFSLLLCHRPDLLPYFAADHFSVALCGHAHGGQVRLPLIGGLFAPNQGIFPLYTDGIYTYNRTVMEVSRGLGNSCCRVRFNNRPQVVILTLRRAQ